MTFKKNVKNITMILLGNTIYCLAIVVFILPNSLITGGTTGLGLSIEHFFGLPLNIFVWIFNISMFILGAVVLGKAFALTTLISSFYYPFILGILEDIPALTNVTNDKMLATICGGIMIGIGIGIVIRAGASTGGMDIPPLVLNKKWGISISVLLYTFDFIILMTQMLFSNTEQIIYGILLVLIYTIVLDKILLMGETKIQVNIISDKYEEINRMIQEKLDRGTTFFYAQTGYLRNEQKVIMTVVNNRELAKLNALVKECDTNAFIIIAHVNEVKGRGFSERKIYK